MAHAMPMAGLVGLDTALEAVRLLAVDPRLGGIAIGASVGSGKSSLARASVGLFGTRSTFVELPLGSDEEALLGGIDIEATLRTGTRTARSGVLARAHGGVLYADALNLLPDSVVNILLGALDTGTVQLEREGMSQQITCRFRLIGTYDPAEGLPRRHLLDRIGLLVLLPSLSSAAERHDVLVHHHHPEYDHWDELATLDAALIEQARTLLPEVVISPEQQYALVDLAVRAGVEGHRVDVFACAVACAAAALDLRTSVSSADLDVAARFVVLPRATRDVLPPEPAPTEQHQPPPPPPAADASPQDDEQTEAEQQPAPQELTPPTEEVMAALLTELPMSLNDLPFRTIRRGRAGSRGATNGTRGRHIRSTAGDPRRARIDVPSTLRAAAPWQPLRHKNARSARRILLRVDDVRVKEFRSKAGVLFCFVVDASGSMALNRMRQAKGAVQTLLQQAYVHRDRVALLAFRGVQCDVLLPASQSVELARRALDILPTGGTTPLAAALLATIEVAKQARGKGIQQCVALFLTDGRGNVGLQDGVAIDAEITTLAAAVAAAGIKSVVIDTQRNYLSRGEGRVLAEKLAGEYIYLPNASGADIAQTAVALA